MSTSVVNCGEGLRNRVSVIIRRYTDHMKFYCLFHILWVTFCIIVYMIVCIVCFCLIFILCILSVVFMYSYYVCSFLRIVFRCVFLCIVCV